MYAKARKQGRWFSLMAKGKIMTRIFIWKTIRKKFLKNSKTSAKKYHKTPIFGDKSSTVRMNPYVLQKKCQIIGTVGTFI